MSLQIGTAPAASLDQSERREANAIKRAGVNLRPTNPSYPILPLAPVWAGAPSRARPRLASEEAGRLANCSAYALGLAPGVATKSADPIVYVPEWTRS